MRVLLVEDDAATAASIDMMLKRENFICDTTDLGEDGLEIGKLYDYDIIILDLMLPDIDGYEVLRRLLLLIEETGPFGTLVLMSYDWDDKKSWLHSMELFARELMPALNKAMCGSSA